MSQTDAVPVTFAHALLAKMRDIALLAGDAILIHYAANVTAQSKADGSPITAADRAAHEIIVARLPALLPGVPVISEESYDPHAKAPAGAFWLVDPLDGTKEFLKRNGEFTVNIALIDHGQPVLGLVHVPVTDVSYAGDTGQRADASRQAWLWSARKSAPQRIAVRRPPEEGITVLASRSHADETALQRYLAGRRVAGVRSAGSSLKFCLLACGDADLYPRFGPTMEWDTAAGQAVLVAAGGQVRTTDGGLLSYGKVGLRNPHFIAEVTHDES